MRLLYDPAKALRFVGDIVARLSRDRLEAGESPISPDELQAAATLGPEQLERVALGYVLRLGEPRYTLSTVAGLAGIPREEVRRFWLALGFAQPDDHAAVFTDGDLIALRELRRLLANGGIDAADTVALARLVGESFARISEALVRLLQRGERQRGAAEAHDVEVAVALAASAAPDVGAIDDLLRYAWKRHLAAAIRRAALRGPPAAGEPDQCVGFADISGFTHLAARVDERELATVLDHFQAAAYEAVVVRGARLVKIVGDEVMFVAETPEVGLGIAADLVRGFRGGGSDIDLHVGLAWGSVLCRDGDYYGRTVNRASRLCDAAPPAGVLIDAAIHGWLAEHGHTLVARPSPVATPGLGATEAWLIEIPSRSPAG